MKRITTTLERQWFAEIVDRKIENRISGDQALLDFSPAGSNSSASIDVQKWHAASGSGCYGPNRSSRAQSMGQEAQRQVCSTYWQGIEGGALG